MREPAAEDGLKLFSRTSFAQGGEKNANVRASGLRQSGLFFRSMSIRKSAENPFMRRGSREAGDENMEAATAAQVENIGRIPVRDSLAIPASASPTKATKDKPSNAEAVAEESEGSDDSFDETGTQEDKNVTKSGEGGEEVGI